MRNERRKIANVGEARKKKKTGEPGGMATKASF